MAIQSKLLERIKIAQKDDPECLQIKKQLEEGKAYEFCLKSDGMLTLFDQVCIPRNEELKRKIMSEAYHLLYISCSRNILKIIY
jgi:hypothetical protein